LSEKATTGSEKWKNDSKRGGWEKGKIPKRIRHEPTKPETKSAQYRGNMF